MVRDESDHRGRGRNRPSRGATIRGFVTGAAVIGALGGAWTLGTYVGAQSPQPAVSDLRASSDLRIEEAHATFAERAAIPERASFADRFGPAVTRAAVASAPAPMDDSQVVALLDPNPSLRAAPGAFRRRLPETPTGWSATPSRVAEAQTPRIAPPKQLALNLPAAPRPTLTLPEPSGSPHERLVQRATARLLTAAASGKASIFEKLLGKLSPAGPVLAYAGPEAGTPGLSPSLAASTSAMDRVTAVYDISKKIVHMPDGSRLEAHSGLGSRLDDPDYAHEKMRGVTPPHIYDLKPREALFHGVPALRMTPIGGEAAIHGRSGILAHTYMLGPKGDSNGCISFKDYYAFLKAYRDGEVKRIVVVDKVV